MKFSSQDYREKVLGCWLGKNIGGTLGAPMEWLRQVNDVSFYTQDLGGEPLPNDDLDLQLVWLLALEQRGLKIDAHDLAEYWLTFITPHYGEYGVAKANLRAGLSPPLSGMFCNDFKDSCGAFIRTEIWACIAPAMPQVAAKYAYEDAIVDHGDGEGTYAAMMIAAMQAAAFAISDFSELIKIGLAYIPADSGVAAAVNTAIECHNSGKTWQQARDTILEKHRGSASWGLCDRASQPDKDKGLDDGKRGYDVPSNIAFIFVGLLYGQGDFSKTLCITVNCGEDTDCTAATVGALWGIIYGAKNIPQKWIEPIGRNIQTMCIAIGELPIPLPATVDELTDRTVLLGRQLALSLNKPQHVESATTDLSDVKPNDFLPDPVWQEHMNLNVGKLKYEYDNFTVLVDFPHGITPDAENNVPLTVAVQSFSPQTVVVNCQWHLPPDWHLLQSPAARVICQQQHCNEPKEIPFTLHCENFTTQSAEFVLSIIIPELAKKITIPITILNAR